MRKRRVLVAGGVLALLLGMAAAAGVLASSGGESDSVSVEMQAGRSVNAITYSITIHNNSSAPLDKIYLSGLVPSGTKFEKATATPAGAWFVGVANDVAAWLLDAVPPGGSVVIVMDFEMRCQSPLS